jgi:cytochrome P450
VIDCFKVVGLLVAGCLALTLMLVGAVALLGENAKSETIRTLRGELSKQDLDLIQVRSEVLRLRITESIATMTVRATEMAGRIMVCDGEPGAVHCAAYGEVWANYEGPIVTCLRGQCRLVRE